VTVLLSVTDEVAVCLAQCGGNVAEDEIKSDMTPAAMAV
jgi:hypothetical protein